jgi:hypothetical protein
LTAAGFDEKEGNIKKYFSQLNTTQYLVLFGIIALLRTWIEFDQTFLTTDAQRRAVFYLLIFISFIGFFYFVKPEMPILLSVHMSIVLLSITVVLSVVQHVIVNHDFDCYYKRSIVLWAVVFTVPYLVGFFIKGQENLMIPVFSCGFGRALHPAGSAPQIHTDMVPHFIAI